MLKFLDLVRMLEAQNTENHALYLLIDAAQDDKAVEVWLNTEPKPEVRSLFEGTLEESLPLQVAPLILKLTPEMLDSIAPTICEWLTDSQMINVLSSTLTVNELVRHLQGFLEAKLPTGRTRLFRFYDPRVALLMFDMMTSKDYNAFFAPISAWWVPNREEFFHALPILKGN